MCVSEFLFGIARLPIFIRFRFSFHFYFSFILNLCFRFSPHFPTVYLPPTIQSITSTCVPIHSLMGKYNLRNRTQFYSDPCRIRCAKDWDRKRHKHTHSFILFCFHLWIAVNGICCVVLCDTFYVLSFCSLVRYLVCCPEKDNTMNEGWRVKEKCKMRKIGFGGGYECWVLWARAQHFCHNPMSIHSVFVGLL